MYYQKTMSKQFVDQETKSHDFNEFEERVIHQALSEGLSIWEIVIKLVDDCLLKSARAFLVFKTLETLLRL